MSEQEYDPALRCDSCQQLLKSESLLKLGCCPHCGNRRVRSIVVCNEKELQQLRDWGLDEMAAEYEQVEVADD